MDDISSEQFRPRVKFRGRWLLNELEAGRVDRVAQMREIVECMERDFEVCRLVLEMRAESVGMVEIVRRLRKGPPWMWRTIEQVKYIALNPHKWDQPLAGAYEYVEG